MFFVRILIEDLYPSSLTVGISCKESQTAAAGGQREMCSGASASQFEWMVNHHYQWCSNIITTIGDGDGDHAIGMMMMMAKDKGRDMPRGASANLNKS